LGGREVASNLDKYKADLEKLTAKGGKLFQAMHLKVNKQRYMKAAAAAHGDKADEHIASLPNFTKEYQRWYSESIIVIKQIIPDRLNDFTRLYEKPKIRKEIQYGTYVIADFLEGISVTRNGEVIVGLDAALANMEQQNAILDSANARFESSLFDMQAMVQADLLDSEIDAARMLAKYKFYRAAGAIAGVVIEKHLSTVCASHKISVAKKNPTIADFNELLKTAGIIDVPQWRFVQHLADIRNMCDHGKDKEPGIAEATGILDGTAKIIKTIY